jgi:hypothetical protein
MQIAILIVALVLAVFVFARLLFPVSGTVRNVSERDRRTGFGEGDPFHAVSIVPADGCCSVVDSIKVQRFLSEEAPSLPLADCAAEDCRCKYIHHADRRGGSRDRRLGPTEHPDELEFWSMRNRRATFGRRQGDLQAA